MEYKKEKKEAEEVLSRMAKQKALEELAPVKAKLTKMGKDKLKDLGVSKNAMALAGMLEAARKGKIRLKKGGLELEGKYTPEEKAIRLKYTKDF